jgi:hypothetical protein
MLGPCRLTPFLPKVTDCPRLWAIRSERSKVEPTASRSSARQELARGRQVAARFGIGNCLARQAELPSVVMDNARVKAGDCVRYWLSNPRIGGVYSA